MIRNSLKLTALAAVALVGGAAGLNCSKGGSTNSGDLKIAFVIPGGGGTIASVTYKITDSLVGTTLAGGTIDTSDVNSTASLDVALPPTAAGATDTVILTATTVAGLACTTAATTFTVTSNANTQVMLSMVCGTSIPQTVPGTVDITTTVSSNNSCPSITSAVVAPDQTSVGATVAVSTTGFDPDNDALTYSWGPAANFAAPTLATTTYRCLTAGQQPISLDIFDGKCHATVALKITCIGAGAGGTPGTGGTATGGTPGTGGTAGAAGAPATGGTPGTGGTATGGTPGTGGTATGGTPGTGGTSTGGTMGVACNQCEFNDSAPPLSFCSGTTVAPSTTTLAAFGCSGLTGTDATNCVALLSCLRGATCQAAIHSADSSYQESGSGFDDPHPCLCGTMPFGTCLGLANSGFTGVCAAQYVAASNGNAILNHFSDTLSPIGIANDLMQCDVDSTVASNGLQNCGPACGLGQ